MNTFHDSAILILRCMAEEGIIMGHSISSGELRELSGLDLQEFDKADDYLLQANLVEGTGGGEMGSRWLTAYGAEYINGEIKKRIPIGLASEKILRFVVDKVKDSGILPQGTILEQVNISEEEYKESCQELKDFDMIKTYGENTISISPTKQGRQAVRKNFQNSTSAFNIQAGAIFNGPITGGNIQAIASAIDSEVQQNVSSLSPEELHKEIEQVLKKLLEQMSEQLNLQQKASYTRLAAELQNEISKLQPDPGVLHKSLAGLGFLADLGGTIDFSQKTFELIVKSGPYIIMLGQMIAQLLQHAAR